jgi:hypothetical protein
MVEAGEKFRLKADDTFEVTCNETRLGFKLNRFENCVECVSVGSTPNTGYFGKFLNPDVRQPFLGAMLSPDLHGLLSPELRGMLRPDALSCCLRY